MPVTTDIVATYRGPGRVVRRLLDMGPREDRALAFVMAFCVVGFIAQLPGLARRAQTRQQDRRLHLCRRDWKAVLHWKRIFGAADRQRKHVARAAQHLRPEQPQGGGDPAHRAAA